MPAEPGSAGIPIAILPTNNIIPVSGVKSMHEKLADADILIARGCGATGVISSGENEVKKNSVKIHSELRGWLEELGIDSVEKIARKHLRANSEQIAALSGIRLAGYDRALPMWFSQ